MSFELLKIDFAETKLPKFKEQKSKGFVSYGEKNDFPQSLLEFYMRAPKHGAIVRTKARFVSGDECVIEGSDEAQKVLEYVNPYEGLHELKSKLALDFEIFNGLCFEVHYNRIGQISALYHVDFSKVRTLDHKSYQYVEDWQKYKAEDVKHYPAFNPVTAQPYSVQLYYAREYQAGLGVYPLPPYQHGLQYVEIEVEIANFHNNNIRNGFSNGTLVQLFKGQPSPEQARIFERKFKERTIGTDNAGGVLIQFNENNEQPATINHLQPSNMDEQFLMLNETVQSEIVIAHAIPPVLAGLRTEGALGQRNELIEAYEIFHKQYVNHRQRKIDYCLQTVLRQQYFGITIETRSAEFIGLDYVELYEAGVVSMDEAREALGMEASTQTVKDAAQRVIESINSLSPLVANNVLANMTINEKRALAGLPPIPNGDVLDIAAPAPAVEPAAFNSCEPHMWHDSKDLDLFMKFGEPASNFEDVSMKFAELGKDEMKVLSVVSADDQTSIDEISEITKIDTDEVTKILKKLQDTGKIKWTNNAIRITDIGKKDINDTGKLPKLELRWKYTLDPDALPLQPGGKSREFCKKMVDASRLYSRQDIETLTARLGYDVWTRRGGWYTVPESEPPLHIPHCRHYWKQQVVRRKN
jgi:DNA-binding MarR family transcriptional regulator